MILIKQPYLHITALAAVIKRANPSAELLECKSGNVLVIHCDEEIDLTGCTGCTVQIPSVYQYLGERS